VRKPRRRDPRMHERQHLPLWSIREHCCSGAEFEDERSPGDIRKSFWEHFKRVRINYTKASDVKQAVGSVTSQRREVRAPVDDAD